MLGMLALGENTKGVVVEEDIKETGMNIKIKLPKGFNKRHLQLRSAGNILLLNASRKTVGQDSGTKYVRSFSYRHKFDGLKISTVDAKVENGFLSIIIKKKPIAEKTIAID